jgi:hypothetical protein
MHKGKSHHDGASLKPTSKFKYAKSRIPMKGPRRSKKVHGRRGGVRG